MRAEIFTSKGKWYWHLRARNGKIVADAESFPTKAHALRGAKACVNAVRKRPAEFTKAELDVKRNCWFINWS